MKIKKEEEEKKSFPKTNKQTNKSNRSKISLCFLYIKVLVYKHHYDYLLILNSKSFKDMPNQQSSKKAAIKQRNQQTSTSLSYDESFSLFTEHLNLLKKPIPSTSSWAWLSVMLQSDSKLFIKGNILLDRCNRRCADGCVRLTVN